MRSIRTRIEQLSDLVNPGCTIHDADMASYRADMNVWLTLALPTYTQGHVNIGIDATNSLLRHEGDKT